jgi:hypothetical protein
LSYELKACSVKLLNLVPRVALAASSWAVVEDFHIPSIDPIDNATLVRLAGRATVDCVHNQSRLRNRSRLNPWAELLFDFLDQIAFAIRSAVALLAVAYWVRTSVLEDFLKNRIDLLRLFSTLVPSVESRRSEHRDKDAEYP